MKSQRSERQDKTYIIVLLLILFIFISRGMSIQWEANKSMLLWVDQLFTNSFHREIVVPESSPEAHLPLSVSTSFGRISFAQDDFSKAATYFGQAYNWGEISPFALSEMAVALSQLDRFEEVIELYETNRESLLWNDAARDAVLIAYLQKLDENRYTIAEVLPILEELAPQTVYVKSLTLLQQAQVETISELPYEAQIELAKFPIESVLPADERILFYSAQTVLDLVESGIWDVDRLVKVVQLWVWQYPNAPALKNLLDIISAQYEDVDWNVLKLELDLRQNQQIENKATPLIPEGMDDVTNMLPNGSFDMVSYKGLPDWREADYITGRGLDEPQAAFFMDVDDTINITPPYALRLDGIWKDDATGFYGAVPVGSEVEGTYLLTIEPETAYRISGYYQTRGDSEQVSVYIGRPELGLIEAGLPATSHTWQEFEFIGCYLNEQAESMQLLLRLESEGTVWFDEIVVQPITSNIAVEVCSE